MSAQTAYTTDDPSVLAKWEDDQRRYKEWVEAAEAWVSQWPECRLATFRDSPFGVYWVAGVYGPPSDQTLWRYDRRRTCWTPRRSLKAARELVAAMDALSVKGIGQLPGMPQSLFTGLSMPSHGIEIIEGHIYVLWGKPSPELIEANKAFDRAIWRRVPLSEFYAAKEAAEAVAS